MRAAVYDSYGGPIELREMPTPEPGPGEVLVRVHAASVNSWDWDKFKGHPLERIIGPFSPRHRILGTDASGIVAAVGTDVTGLRVGDRVAGDLAGSGWGGFAEFFTAPAKAMVPVPDGVGFEAAAAVPHAGLLALQALRERTPVAAGEHVLIIGAGGGAGTFAIQLAKQAGAEVTAVDRADKLDLLSALGADHVIDYTREDVARSGRRFDRILDPVAKRPMSDYRRLLTDSGLLVVIGGRLRTILAAALSGRSMDASGGQALRLLLWRADPADIREMLDLCASGAIRPVIDRFYTLEDTGAALQRLGEGAARGKLVITMTG